MEDMIIKGNFVEVNLEIMREFGRLLAEGNTQDPKRFRKNLAFAKLEIACSLVAEKRSNQLEIITKEVLLVREFVETPEDRERIKRIFMYHLSETREDMMMYVLETGKEI